jgi:hypothetical protein
MDVVSKQCFWTFFIHSFMTYSLYSGAIILYTLVIEFMLFLLAVDACGPQAHRG